jgi:hypothetical protein
MPYIIEYYHKTSYKELPYTVKNSKAELLKEVEEMNRTVDKEVTRFLPVKEKYRVKKIKNGDRK